MSKVIFLFEIVILSMKKNIRLNGIVVVSLMLGLLIPFIAFANINVFIQDMESLTPRISENVYYYDIITQHITKDKYQSFGDNPEIKKIGGYEYLYCNIGAGETESRFYIYAVSEGFLDFINIGMQRGRLPTEQELSKGSTVCLVEESFFTHRNISEDSIEKITVDGNPMDIIGIFKSMDFKGTIIIPSAYLDQNRLLQERQHVLYVQFESKEQMGNLQYYFDESFEPLSMQTVDEYYKTRRQLCIMNSIVIFLIALPLVIFAVLNSLLVIYGKIRKMKQSMGIKMALGSGRKEIFLSCFAENILLGAIAFAVDMSFLPIMIKWAPAEILLEFDLLVYFSTLLLLFFMCLLMSFLAAKKVMRLNITAVLRGE